MIEKIKSYIFKELIFTSDPDAFGNDDNLLDAGLDSMGIMRLVIFIEDEIGVSLPDDELEPENLETLNKLVNWISRHQ